MAHAHDHEIGRRYHEEVLAAATCNVEDVGLQGELADAVYSRLCAVVCGLLLQAVHAEAVEQLGLCPGERIAELGRGVYRIVASASELQLREQPTMFGACFAGRLLAKAAVSAPRYKSGSARGAGAPAATRSVAGHALGAHRTYRIWRQAGLQLPRKRAQDAA